MCGVHFCFKYFIQILYFCGEKVKCGSSTSPELEAGQLWCVYLQQTHSRAPHSTNQTCRAVKKMSPPDTGTLVLKDLHWWVRSLLTTHCQWKFCRQVASSTILGGCIRFKGSFIEPKRPEGVSLQILQVYHTLHHQTLSNIACMSALHKLCLGLPSSSSRCRQ